MSPVSDPISAANRPRATRELVVSHVFDAPRECAFDAWIDSTWWLPEGLIDPTYSLDVRPGGGYRIDGAGGSITGFFCEVVAPIRLTMTLDLSDAPKAWLDLVHPGRDRSGERPALEAILTVTFDDVEGKTKVTLRHRFETAEIRDAMLRIGMAEGWDASLAALDRLLSNPLPKDQA
ncbi:MAG: SRPBCC family protein [Fimbriimonas sp.]